MKVVNIHQNLLATNLATSLATTSMTEVTTKNITMMFQTPNMTHHITIKTSMIKCCIAIGHMTSNNNNNKLSKILFHQKILNLRLMIRTTQHTSTTTTTTTTLATFLATTTL